MQKIESGEEGFNIEIDAQTWAIEAEFMTNWEEILNQEILSGECIVVMYYKAEIQLFRMKACALWMHCR
jgi:hypothetical protein